MDYNLIDVSLKSVLILVGLWGSWWVFYVNMVVRQQLLLFIIFLVYFLHMISCIVFQLCCCVARVIISPTSSLLEYGLQVELIAKPLHWRPQVIGLNVKFLNYLVAR